jgi:hypothetical protein
VGCCSYQLYRLFQTPHSFSVTIFTLVFLLFFILLQINLTWPKAAPSPWLPYPFECWWGAYHFKDTYSPITLAKISSINLVFIFRCSSSPDNPVYPRRIDLRWENRTANRPPSRKAGMEMPCCPASELLWVLITQSYPNRLRFSNLPCPQSPCHDVIHPVFKEGYFWR